MHLQNKTQAIEECIRSCQSCHEICVETASLAVRMGGEHTEHEHVSLITDCAEICNVSLNSMLRNSTTSLDLCRTCADICDVCAADCERFVGNQQMQACARECRRCAQACRQMVAAATPIGGAAAGHGAAAHGGQRLR
ncbi:four-helix bundle copper-binding protein [Sorangium sp. So ce1036]|uniref:four-helix bundle copper-binding protein n=1 Tax=Sorangium sp. So ce1036 TaxID=3133328 RepID=UPI003F02121F